MAWIMETFFPSSEFSVLGLAFKGLQYLPSLVPPLTSPTCFQTPGQSGQDFQVIPKPVL
jgi:hypothetical protein